MPCNQVIARNVYILKIIDQKHWFERGLPMRFPNSQDILENIWIKSFHSFKPLSMVLYSVLLLSDLFIVLFSFSNSKTRLGMPRWGHISFLVIRFHLNIQKLVWSGKWIDHSWTHLVVLLISGLLGSKF